MVKFIFTLLAFGALISSSWADEAAMSGLKIKRLSSGAQRPSQSHGEGIERLSEEVTSFGGVERSVGEQETVSLSNSPSHPLGESLVIPKRKHFSDW